MVSFWSNIFWSKCRKFQRNRVLRTARNGRFLRNRVFNKRRSWRLRTMAGNDA